MTISVENWHFELETGIDMFSFLCWNLFRIVRHHYTLRSEQRMWRWWIFFSTMEHPLMPLIRFVHNSFQLWVLKLIYSIVNHLKLGLNLTTKASKIKVFDTFLFSHKISIPRKVFFWFDCIPFTNPWTFQFNLTTHEMFVF